MLKEDITIAGPIAVPLYASTTGTDADWIVKLIDVFPGEAELGYHQMLLAAETFRDKYRNSYSTPEPLVPGKATEIRLVLPDGLHRFLKGHRMMVQVQSTLFPVVDRNAQTLVDTYAAEEDDFQKAVLRVYRTPKHPSAVTVPVLEP